MHPVGVEVLDRQRHRRRGPRFLAHDGAGHQVAGGQLTCRLVAGHETLAVDVEQPRAFAAQGLREQEARRAGNGDDRRMELHELEIADRRPGRPRQRHAVAGGDRGIGRLAEDAAGAAGGQQRSRGAHLGEPAVLDIARADAAPALDGRGPRRGRRGRWSRRGWPPRAATTPVRSRGRWHRGREARGARCGRPRGRARKRRRRRDRTRRPTRRARRPGRGPSSTSARTASGRQRPSPAAIVSSAWRVGESSPPTAAAMPPWAYPVLLSSGDAALVSTSTRPAPASVTAARNPATPLPMTRKSAARQCTATCIATTSRVRVRPVLRRAPPACPSRHPSPRARRRLRHPCRRRVAPAPRARARRRRPRRRAASR